MFETIKNVFAIKELRQRILFTLAMLAIYRIGSYVPCPFVSLEQIEESFSGGGMSEGIFGMADMFTGGAFSRLTVTSLGIMPYISASIILQLMMVVYPRLEKLSKEGESGRKKITQYTRIGTVGLAMVQGFGLGAYILNQPELIMPAMRGHNVLFLFSTMVSVTAGTTFLMWLGEKISEKGIGNGISLLITMGIIARYPSYVRLSLDSVKLESVAAIWLLIVAGICVLATVMIVLIQEGARKIPIQHAKQMVGRRMQTAQTNYLPLKVNTAGVMPVIFSSAILTLPATVFAWFDVSGNGTGFLGSLGQVFSQQTRFNLYYMFNVEAESIFLLLKAANMYTFMFVVLTAFFCFFYTAIVFNPQDVADNLRRQGAFVPGYRPGKPTADYIDKVMTRITLVGAVFLCSVSILPQLLMSAFDLPFSMADFAGGTGLIIVVAVVLDTMKQIESRMLMRNYEGFQTRRSKSGTQNRWSREKKKA